MILETRQTEKDGLQSAIQAAKLVGGKEAVDAAIARHQLERDTGGFSDSFLPDYGLSEKSKDTLLAHARQDAAHSLIVATRLSSEIANLRHLVVVLIGMVGILIWHVW